MKKLYFLDESEKERILSLHESHTKKKYLMNEQDLGSFATNLATNVGVTMATPLGFIPGALPAAVLYTLWTSWGSATTRDQFNKIVMDACKQAKDSKPTLGAGALQDKAEALRKLISPLGYATTTSRKGIKDILSSLPSIPDLCGVMTQYRDLYSIELLTSLSKEIYVDENWTATVKSPLKRAIDASREATAKAKEQAAQKPAETLVGWEKYPCVTTNPNAKKFSLKDGSVTYEINGVDYYGNGRKRDQSGKMSDYHCGADGLIKEGPKPAGGSTAAVTTTGGGGGGLGTRITTIQKQVGLTQSGTMDQATINALMTKIQGGSGSATNTATTPQAKGLE